MPRPADEPDYRQPPIDEVALGLYYDPLPGFVDAYAGLFWKTVKETYPTALSRQRLDTGLETLQGDPIVPVNLPLLMGTGAPGRTWLISRDDIFVLQLQDNLFMRNWRKREAPYPHFESLLEAFWTDFSNYRNVLSGEGLAAPTVRQLEVSYINWIPDGDLSSFLRPATAVDVTARNVDSMPDSQSWIGRYTYRRDDVATARIYVQCQPAARVIADATAVGAQFSLVFRAPFEAPADDERLGDTFRLASRAIVDMFTQLTTEGAHVRWERYQ